MKRFLSVFLTVVCLVTLSSYSSSSAENDSDSTIASLEKRIDELEERVAKLEANSNLQLLFPDLTDTDIISDNASNNPNTGEPVAISLNNQVSIGDVMKLTLLGAEWDGTILPSNTSNGYSYMEDIDGETYFVVRGSITSNCSDSFDLYCANASIRINDKYSFDAYMALEYRWI